MTDRRDVEFKSGNDLRRAWFYRPESDDPALVIVVGHGLGATRVMKLEQFARRFVEAMHDQLDFLREHVPV